MASPIPSHRLPVALTTALALGYGGSEAVHTLMRGERSRRRILLVELLQTPALRDRLDASAQVLHAAERVSASALDRIIDDPLTGAWLLSAIRAARHAVPSAQALSSVTSRLAVVAALAALAAGTPAEVVAFADGGWLYLPTLGRLRVDRADDPLTVVVDGTALTVSGVAVVPTDPALPGPPGWQPLRTLNAPSGSQPVRITLNDIDPYRDIYHVRAEGRLTDGAYARWRSTFTQAWQLMNARSAWRAEEVAAGLHTIVPLYRPDGVASNSATVRTAGGAAGIDLPNTAVDLMVSLVHEFQHSKLGAVTEMLRLYENAPQAVYFAPWKDQFRPLGSLLHGAYAFLAVADTWRSLIGVPELDARAIGEFVTAREQVRVVLDTLGGCDWLTVAGHQFVAGMIESFAALDRVDAPARLVADARSAVAAMRRARTGG